MRDSRGGGTHSETERKRRDYMNEQISTLKALVPNFDAPKPNKVTILGKAVEYMSELTETNTKLQDETEELRKEVERLRNMVIKDGPSEAPRPPAPKAPERKGSLIFGASPEMDLQLHLQLQQLQQAQELLGQVEGVGPEQQAALQQQVALLQRKTKNLFDLPLAVYESVPQIISDDSIAIPDLNLKQFIAAALRITMENLIVTDPNIVGHPIVYASPGFQRMTGYTEAEIIGRNCRFLQGSATDRHITMELGKAIREKREYLAEILNYRKDGTPFWNLVYIDPVLDKDNEVVVFLGVQFDITSSKSRGDKLAKIRTASQDAIKEIAHAQGYTPADTGNDWRFHMPLGPRVKSELGLPALDAAPSEELKVFLASVLHMAMHAVCVIEGKGPPAPSPLDDFLALDEPCAEPKHAGRGSIVYVTRGFEEMTGWKRAELVGRRLETLHCPESDQKTVAAIRECLASSRPGILLTELLMQKKDGTRFWNLMFIYGVPDTRGETALNVLLTFDITQHRGAR
uniref:Putative LOV domain-containing protein n=1 Tax=Cyanophora paradoxa TaxID=2762 RepID=A0A126X0X3_CYAPA|nr:putative LOV domain-containing protein [Cyanophora paradoxa]